MSRATREALKLVWALAVVFVMLAGLSFTVVTAGEHWRQRDLVPVSCLALGGDWSLWGGWQCGG